MIKTWSVEHFKSVYESTTLSMSPLTIFTGANSSGKSTIIQSLLLTTQTIQNSIHSKSVILNGHIIKLGTFNDILSNNHKSNNISIGFDLDISHVEAKHTRLYIHNRIIGKSFNDDALVSCKFSFSSKNKDDNNDITQLHPDLQYSEVQVQMNDNDNEKVESNKIIIKRSKQNIKERKLFYQLMSGQVDDEASLQYEVDVDFKKELIYYPFKIDGVPAGARLLHFLPERLTLVFDEVQEKAKHIVRLLVDPETSRYRYVSYEDLENEFNDNLINIVMDEIKAVNLEYIENEKLSVKRKQLIEKYSVLKENFSFENFMMYFHSLPTKSQKLFESKMKQKENKLLEALTYNKKPRFQLDQAELPNSLDYAVINIKNFFSNNVKYLGPLRDEPKPVYPHSGTTDSKDVGFKGEHTAAVLEIHKKTLVEYVSPQDLIKEGIMQTRRKPLLYAVLEWLEYMGVVKDVKTVDRGKLGHELKVIIEEGNSFHDLTNVGVGVSQVLPILVLSLLAEKGSTLIFEQPELHLHPRVQTRLADFFVSMMQLKKQCIVESHSEYLINRLRYRSVVSKDDSISKNVIMYFVEKENGKSKYNPVKINKYGVIEKWPKGFFDENEENSAAILRAAMEKRKKERKG
ncbi:DUF3696 domain-containing protein [Priestia megaterium]|uniref:DUF3696 domain-containing protein n=1 Tax=Priestia megaterium TaxID=1404 RepID=UPI0035C99D83